MRTLVSSSKANIRKLAPNVSSSDSERLYFDAFRRQLTPTADVLVNEYKRVAYTCANLNATGVSLIPLRLYVKTESGDRKSVLKTKSLTDHQIERLERQSYLQKTLRSYVNVEEVVSHPVLDLLERGNDSRFINGQRICEIGQLYQEILGQEYWLLETDPLFNLPQNIWILPSQWVTPVKKNENSNSIIDLYEYSPPGIAKPIEYQVDDIIPFLMPSIHNPYVEGVSPLQAAFQANEVNNKLLTHEDALLQNEGRPDAIVAPKDAESAFGPDMAERYEKEWRARFTRGRSGGIWVPDDPVTFTPVTFPPRDLARLEINKWSKNDLANTFQIPFALVSDASHNRQQLEAAEVQHAKHAILPRLNRRAAILNDVLLPMYDISERLFLAYDNPIPEDEEKKLQTVVQLVMNGIAAPNWGAEEFNIPMKYRDTENGDKPRAINVSPELARDNARGSGEAEK